MAWGTAASYIIPAVIGMLGQQDTNSTNSANTAATNATNIELANTSYQRRVKDLSAAGLNPMLAYTQGGAANPNMVAPQYSSPLNAGVTSGSQGASLYQAQKLMESQVASQKTQQDVNKAIEVKTKADAAVSAATAQEIYARIPTYGTSIDKMMKEIDYIGANTGLSQAQTDLVKKQATNAVLQGKNIEADTGNKMADNLIKGLTLKLQHQDLRQETVQSNAAESPLGRYVMPFIPFWNSSANSVKNR